MEMKHKSVGIIGAGFYVPEKIVTNKDLEKIVDTSDEWIVSRTGIRERRIMREDQATSDLATEAARRALAAAELQPEDIDLILVATCTPDMLFPSVACLVQANLGAKKAAALDIQAACSGFVYGMATAMQFIQTGVYKHVLVIGAESFSRLVDWQDRNTCVLFGDGAGAAVIGEVEEGYGILGIELGADGSGAQDLNLPAGGTRLPASTETLAARQHFVHMKGQEVFKFAVKVMGEAAMKALERAHIAPEQVDLLVPHQANIRIIQSAAKRLNLPMEKVVVNVDRYGNTSAATIPIALVEAMESGRLKRGDNIVLVGFGAGLTWAACVMKWNGGKKLAK